MSGDIRSSVQGLNETGSQLSVNSHDLFNNDVDDGNLVGPNFEKFRSRTQSNISVGASSSPRTFDEYPPWLNKNTPLSGSVASNVNEIMSRTDQMCLDAAETVAPDYKNGIKEGLIQQRRHSPLQQPIKQEEIKVNYLFETYKCYDFFSKSQ
jgi:hypothetical protein